VGRPNGYHSFIALFRLQAKCAAAAVECVVGFAAVPHPQFSNSQMQTYVCTNPQPAIVMERLSKDIEKRAIGPARLIESANFEVVYRKILTGEPRTPLVYKIDINYSCRLAHAWGNLIFENLFALNIITGGSLAHTLSRNDWRELYAAMIREDYKVGATECLWPYS
jgi:hypothetical protein